MLSRHAILKPPRRRAILRQWYGHILRLYFVADTHIGSAACDETKLVELAHIISQDPFSLAVGLGDYIEAISWSDKRFDAANLSQPISPEHLDNPFYTQALRFAKIFEPTRGKWLCMVTGNHEERATHYYHFDPIGVIAERLGTVYHGGSDCGGWVRIKMNDGTTQRHKRNTVELYLTHGYGGGELRGGDALKLQRLLLRKQADIVAMGHGHKATLFPEAAEGLDPKGYEQSITRWGIEAYPLVGKHGYLAKRGANAPPTGYVVVSIERNCNGLAKISVEMHEL